MDQIVYSCADWQLDTAKRTFIRSGTEYPLEPKVLAVLTQLLMRPGQLLTREELLDAVWGHRYVTPSTLNRVIALARRSLLDDAENPKFIQTVHGSGYRFVGIVEKTRSAASEGRVRFAPPASVRLPACLQQLIGRDLELAQISRLLEEGRSLTILGAGGMGKTQCALAAAHACRDRFPDGIWFFDLAPRRSALEWLQVLALSLAIAASSERELLDRITESLLDRRALLLLDNCDRLSAGVGALVIELLRGTEHLKVLATSQQQLGFVSERILRMPPLEVPRIGHDQGLDELQRIAAAPAVALLIARIRDSREEFKLTAEIAPTLVAICERLDGMPLALELAAPRFALLSPDQVLDRLNSRFRFLVSGDAGRDHRHRNLVALLEWGFALLSTDEQRLLTWLSVFVQGWTVDAVIDLAPVFGTSPENAVDLLTGLANKSLTSVDQSVSPPRYRLLESVREFALEQLKVRGDEQRARDAHLDYILRMTELVHADLLGVRMRERIALLMPEHANIDSASEYAAGAGANPQAALKIAGLLTLYFKSHGESGFALRLCERALARAPDTASRELALTQLCRGINILFGRKIAAEVPLLEAARIAAQIGDEWTEAYACGHLALWLANTGETRTALPHLETIDRLANRRDDALLRGLTGLVRGWLHFAKDEIDASLATLRSVRHLGSDLHQRHFIEMYIGLCLFRLGDCHQAAADWHEAMRNAIVVGHLRGISGSLEGCAYIAERLDHPREACQFLSAAERMRERAASPLFSFWVRHHEHTRASLRRVLGRPDYESAIATGARMHAEDAINEAAQLLQRFAGGTSAH